MNKEKNTLEPRTCKECGNILIVNDNWYPTFYKHHIYKCKTCFNKMQKKLYLRSESKKKDMVSIEKPKAAVEVKRKKIVNTGDRVCIKCGTVIIPGENLLQCFERLNIYICRNCHVGMETKYRNKRNFSSVHVRKCLDCGVELIVGKTTSEARVKQRTLKCNKCYNKKYTHYERRKPDISSIPSEDVSVDILCGVQDYFA